MNIDAIERIVKIIEASSVKEFSYSEGDVEIYISTLDNPPVVAAAAPQGAVAVPAPAAPAAVPAATTTEEAASEELFITAPIVATFYSAAAPDVPAFVKVGDRVKAGEPVCILEAMKLMYEITAEYDCEIEAILVSNEQRVEYGQPLFRVKKL